MIRAFGSTLLTQTPSCGPPWRWKYHHGMPFCIGSTIVVVVQQRRQVVEDRLHLVRLDAEDDDVVDARGGEIAGRADVAGDFLAPVGEDEAQAAAADRLEVRAAGDDGDFVPRIGQQDGEMPADRARSDHTDPHAAPNECRRAGCPRTELAALQHSTVKIGASAVA